MLCAPIPLCESQRLKELYSYEVLDSATDKTLDNIAQSAATICGTTFGAISLLDLDRQWFKAQFGFSFKETVRSYSICGDGILHPGFIEVPDTEADQRFQDNELLESMGVRFYGGSQFIGTDGQVRNMLCVLDPEPKQLGDSQHTKLATLSIKAMELLEVQRQRRRMEWLGALVSQVPDEIYPFDFSTVTLNAAAQAGDQIRLTVAYQDSGVPEDFQTMLFERFAQANTKTIRLQGGSGLGLSTVNSITEAMGGSVACMSRPGCTEFMVELPQAKQVFP